MLSEDVKKLVEKCKTLENLLFSYSSKLTKSEETIKKLESIVKMVLPEKIYTHKERRNTTVKFKDGSSVTVKRKSGEKDCIETAIAYCIMEHVLPKNELKKLIKEREVH